MAQLPLHPVIVHFPLALIALAPAVMAILTWGILTRKWNPRTWLVAVVLQALILVSVLGAAKLGERDEEAVEAVVSEQYIETHEEWAEKLVWFSGFLFLASLIPLFFKKQSPTQIVATVLSLGSLFLAFKTGHSGGELVYKHGAAAAFIQAYDADPAVHERSGSGHREDHDDDD